MKGCENLFLPSSREFFSHGGMVTKDITFVVCLDGVRVSRSNKKVTSLTFVHFILALHISSRYNKKQKKLKRSTHIITYK